MDNDQQVPGTNSNPEPSAPPAEPPAQDDQQTQTPAAPEPQEQPEAPAESDESEQPEQRQQPEAPPSRSDARRQSYIDRLSEQIQASNSRRDNRSAELFQPRPYNPLDYNQALDVEDPNVVKQFEADRQTYGYNQYASGYQQGAVQAVQPLQNQLWLTNLRLDTQEVASEYQSLNESSPDWNPDLTSEVNTMYLQFIGYQEQPDGTVQISRPDVSYADYARAFMQSAQRLSEVQAEKTTQNIAKQAGNQGLRPNATARRSGYGDLTRAGAIVNMDDEQWNKGGREAVNAAINRELGL